MTELTINSYFRSQKCQHNDSGYCKFGDKCRKKHAINVCSTKNCDKNCSSRHPIPCKYKKRCKFHAKQICAFSHAKSIKDDTSDDCESDLVELKKQVESLKNENEHKKLELIKIEKEIKAIKEIKIVVTTLIKDVEDKSEKISELEKETSKLKLEIESLKKETADSIKDLKEEFSKNMKEMKIAVTALIIDAEETKREKPKCKESNVEERREQYKNVQNSKTNLEKHKLSNMSNFRFDFGNKQQN